MIGRQVAGRFEVLQHSLAHELFDVYRAVDAASGRNLRLRILKASYADDTDLAQEIVDVGERLKSLRHPSVEGAVEAGMDGSLAYYASDWTEGQTLSERLKRLNTLSVSVGLSVAIGVAEGLHACHQSGVVHGDVSDRTVLSRPGEGVKLMEAGCWRAYGMSPLAARAMVPMMAPYLAPEITSGEMPSPESDISALGALIYLILSGRPPFVGDSPNVIALKHHSAPYPSLRSQSRGIPEALDAALEKCLAKRPEARWHSAGELAAHLRSMQEALRFGRAIPQRAPAAEPEPVADAPSRGRRMIASVDDTSSAPEASAEKAAKPAKPEKAGAVPRPLVFLAYLFGVVCACILGVWFFLLLQPPAEFDVPDVVGMSLVDAAGQLDESGINYRKVEERPSDGPADVILEQSPQPGEKMRSGQSLNLTVSSGTAKVEVPDVKGELASEAQPKLEAIGFTVETDEVAGSGRPPGEVISQDPAAGQEAARKSVVKLTVASAANMISGSRTRRKYSYRIEVPTDMPDRVDLRVVMLDASGEEVVFEDRVNPGFIATVERDGYGDKVRFITRINGVTVDELETGPDQEVEN